jgi:hypothetical protein
MNTGNEVEKPRAVVAKLSEVTLLSVAGGGSRNAQSAQPAGQPPVIHQIPVAVPL